MSKLTSELMLLNFMASVLACVIYFGFAIVTNKYAEYNHLYLLGATSLLLSAFPAEWFFQGMEKFRYVATRSFSLNIVSLILLFVLVRTPADLYWYYGITVIILALNVIINLRQLRKETSITLKGLEFKRHLKPLTYLFSSQIAISVYVLLDKVILGYMVDDKYLGYYASALKIAKVLLTVISALSIVIVPQMSKAFKNNDSERVNHLYRRAVSFVHSIGCPITAGLMCLSNEIILALTGKDFLPSALCLQIMAPIIFLIGLNNIFGVQILTAKGKEKLLLRCVLIGTVVNVVANLVLIPYWQHNGAAVAILLTELFVALLTGYFAGKEINTGYDWGQLLLNCVLCLPFWGIYYLVRSEQVLLTIFGTAGLCGSYYALVQIFLVRNSLWVDSFDKIKSKLRGANV